MNRGIVTSPGWTVIAALVLSVAVGATLQADDEAIDIRRIYVPEKHLSTYFDQDDWIPIRFGRLDELRRTRRESDRMGREVWFSHARYRVRFDPANGQLLDGTGKLSTINTDLPDFIPLTSLSVGLSGASWTSGHAALLGTDASGRQKVRVLRDTGPLQLQWSLPGRRTLRGFEFPLDLPAAIVTTLELATPAGWSVRVRPESITVTNVGTVDGHRIWRVHAGLRNSFSLRLEKESDEGPETAFVAARDMHWQQRSRYAIRRPGISGRIEFDLGTLDPDSGTVAMAIPREQSVQTIHDGSGRTMSWSSVPGATPLTSRVVVSTAELSPNGGRIVVTVQQAVGAERGTSIRMPRLESGILIDGRVSVDVEQPLIIARHQSRGMRQAESIPADERHTISFQQYRPDARIDLQMREPVAGRIHVDQEIVTRLDQSPWQLGIDLGLTAQSQPVFDFTGLLPRDWEIVAVQESRRDGDDNETAPELDWTVVPESDTHDRVTIRFPDGLPVRDARRIRIVATFVGDSLQPTFVLPMLAAQTGTHEGVQFYAVTQGPASATRIQSPAFRRSAVLPWADVSERPALLREIASDARIDRFTSTVSEPAELRDVIWTPARSSAEGDDTDESASSLATGDGDDSSSTERQSENSSEAASPGDGGAEDAIGARLVAAVSLESRLHPARAGRDEFVFTWRFLNPVKRQVLSVDLPAEAKILRVEWNGQPVPSRGSDVPVSGGPTGSQLTFRYTMPSQDVHLRAWYPCRVPACRHIATAGFDWKVLLPAEFAVVSFPADLVSETSYEPGWLEGWFGPLARSESQHQFNPMSVDSWLALIEQSGDEGAGVSRPAHAGSTTHPRSIQIHICRLPQLHGLAWLILILTSLIGITLRSYRLRFRSLTGLIWLTACLLMLNLVPPTYQILVGAAIVGTLLSLVIPRQLIRSVRLEWDSDTNPESPPDGVSQSDVQMPSTFSMRSPAVPMLLIALAAGSVGLAQTETLRQPEDGTRPVEILVPYKGRFQPSDHHLAANDVVFIKRAELEQFARPSIVRERGTESLITHSQYELRIGDDDRAQLSARFQVAVPQSQGIAARLPVTAGLLRGRVQCRIDGQPAFVLPDSDGRAIRVSLPSDSLPHGDPVNLGRRAVAHQSDGWHQFEVLLTVNQSLTKSEGNTELVVPHPLVASSRVSVSFASDPAQATLNGLDLLSVPAERRARMVIGPATQLRLLWSDDSRPRAHSSAEARLQSSVVISPRRLDRESLIVLETDGQRPSPLGVLFPADAQLDVTQVRTNLPAEIRIQDINAGRMMIWEFLQNPVVEEGPEGEPAPVRIRVPWRQPAAETSVSPIQWERVVSPTNPGTLSEPSLSDSSQRTVGLSAAFGFQFEDVPLPESNTEAVRQWLSAWPEEERPRLPQILASRDDTAALNLKVVPLEPVRTLQINQVVQVLPERVKFEYSAEIETSDAPAFTHEIILQEGQFDITSVVVDADGVDRLSHWVLDGNRILLHLNGQTADRIQHVVLAGTIDRAASNEIELPQFTFKQSQIEESILHVYADPEFDVTVRSQAVERIEPEADSSRESEATPGRVRLTGRYRLAEGTASRLLIEPASRGPSATSFARVRNSPDHQCLLELRTRIDDLTSSELVVSMVDWPLDSSHEPSAASSTTIQSQSFDSDKQELRIQWGDNPAETELTVAVPLSVGLNQTVMLPPVSLPGIDDHVQTLPGESSADEATVLSQAALDRVLSEFPELTAEQHLSAWTEAVAVRVPLQVVEPGAPLPPLVLHALVPARQSSTTGVTRMFFSTQGQSEFLIRWPNGLKLVSSRLNGQVLENISQASQLIRIPIQKPDSPQQLELFWERRLAGPSFRIRRWELKLPEPDTRAPAESIVLMATLPDANVLQSGESVSDERLDPLLRDIGVWRGLEHEIRNAFGADDYLNAALVHQLLALPDESGDQAARVTALFHRSDEPAELSPVSEHGVAALLRRSPESCQLSLVGPGQSLTFWTVDSRVKQILSSVLLAVLVIPIVVLLVRIRLGDRLARWPVLSWLLLGIVWWTCLGFSAAGFVLMLASVVALAWQLIWFAIRTVLKSRRPAATS